MADIRPMALFTAETAAQAAKLSHAAGSARYRVALPEPKPEPIPQAAVIPADNGYLGRRLARVRAQIEWLSDQIDSELSKKQPDGQQLNWFCTALERLSELERTTDGRPLPGSRRPGREVTRRNALPADPTPAETQPPAS